MLLKYPTSNIILNIEMVRNVNYEKEKIKLFVVGAISFSLGGTDFFLLVALFLLPSSLFTTTIGSLPPCRTDCTTWTKKDKETDWELEHFCDSHIYKCRTQAESTALKIFTAS